MRIAVVYATDFDEIGSGGIQNFIWRVGAAAPVEVEVTYFLLGAPVQLPRPTDHFVSLGHPPEGAKINAFFTGQLRRLNSALDTYDIIVLHRVEYIFAVPRRSPVVTMVHGGSFNAFRARRSLFGVVYPLVEATAFGCSRRVLSVDPQSIWPISRLLAGRLAGIRTPASPQFKPRGVPPSRNTLFTASRLVPEKRVTRLIELSAATGWPLVIFGDGPEQGSLRQLALQKKARVEFRGLAGPDDIAREYRRGGVFCLASQFEGYPLAAVEAACIGLPVVGVASNAVRQLASLGAVRAASVAEAATMLQSGEHAHIDAHRAWELHSPEAVASRFWAEVLRARSDARAPRLTRRVRGARGRGIGPGT